MTLDSEVTKRKKEDGTVEEVLNFTFSNGAKQQLEDLKKHFDMENALDVVKLGISFLQHIKEEDDKGSHGKE